MSCNSCQEGDVVQIIGLCDPDKFTWLPVSDPSDKNWTEISIPEVLKIPIQKPDIEHIDQVFISVKIISLKLIETPSATVENAEGTRLTGRKLIVEGIVNQKIVYTAEVDDQSVHSAHFEIPFSAFIIMPANTPENSEFKIDKCVEDVFVKALDNRTIFKNVTLFLRAIPYTPTC